MKSVARVDDGADVEASFLLVRADVELFGVDRLTSDPAAVY